jgi:Raf kinase inhibitor-like YbhB/YbcL family protein
MKIKMTLAALCLAGCLHLTARAQTFTLKSTDLQGQFTADFTANVFGCTGANKSPELEWSNAPAGTKSFAVTMYDPDAPTGSGWWHWVVFDIPPAVTSFKQGAGNITLSIMPPGVIQSLTDFGVAGYGGPCPPVNDKPHAYVITVYALKTAKLGLDKNATPALVGYLISQQLLAKASLIVYNKR